MDRPEQIEAQTIYARRKWSAERLNIPLDASKKDARTQWLKSLEENDFLPDEIDLPAWRIVSNAECAAAARKKFPAWSSHFDDAIGQEIEAFSQRFFSLEPDVRRKEFTRLLNASRDNPRQQKRLSSLSPALKLPRTALNEETDDEDAELMLADVEEVSQHLRALFVATPPARARMHLEFLREHADELLRWASAAKVLKDTHSPLVDLVPHEWEDLSGCDVKQRQAAEFQAGLEERVAIQALKDQREDAAVRSDSGSFLEGLFFNRYAMFAAVWIAIKIGGAVLNSSPSPPKINYTMPSTPAPNVQFEDFMRRMGEQRKKHYEQRRWVTMDEEEFKASHGEDRIKSLGLEKERQQYWEWHRKLIAYESMLEEAIEKRNNLQATFDEKKKQENVLRMRIQGRQEVEKLSGHTSSTLPVDIQKLQDDLTELQIAELELRSELDQAEKGIARLRVIVSALNNTDPSVKPLDASP